MQHTPNHDRVEAVHEGYRGGNSRHHVLRRSPRRAPAIISGKFRAVPRDLPLRRCEHQRLERSESANAGLVLFGLWCYAARVRPGWLWSVLELGNGIGTRRWRCHKVGTSQGVATAPVLLAGVTLSGRHTLGSALVMASSRCGVEDVQRHSRE